MNSADLSPFQELVRRRSGLQLETMAESSLRLALGKRMAATKSDTPSAYCSRVLRDEGEFDELVSLLTINETYFFREPRQLELLTQKLLPALLAKGTDLPLRILSAGCSTGEEPYSIAIAILEKFGESAGRLVSIVAGDIDQHALRRARQAEYPEYSFRATPAALRERYFTPASPRTYRPNEQVRAMVEFQSLNLLASKLPEKLTNLDVVFFRNVSIYFDAPTRERIQRTLRDTMRETGYLILGTAETLANDLGVFRLHEDDGSFYFVKDNALQGPAPAQTVRPTTKPELTRLRTAKTHPRLMMRKEPSANARPDRAIPIADKRVTEVTTEQREAVIALLRSKQHREALEKLAPLRRAAPEDIDLQLLESYALLQSRRFAEATVLAQRVLDHNHWCVEAMILLGFAAKWQEDGATATAHFKAAVYTQPDCWAAHYYLGGLLQETEVTKARREYRTALMQLTSNPDPDGGLRLPLNLPIADIRFLCKRRSVVSGEPS